VNLIRNPARRESGFSLVELMVGMVIGLLAVVVMFQVFEVTEAQRRTTTGAGDAQQNGVTSLFLMERDARMAGYGFNYAPMFNCRTNGFYAPTGTNFTFRMLPVQITDGSGKGTDAVTFTYGTADSFALPGVLATATASTPNYFKLEDPRYQFNAGDLVVVTEIPNPMIVGPMKDCWVTQVTGLPDIPYLDRVQFGATSYIDAAGTTRAADYTPPFALPVSYVKWVKKEVNSWGGRLLNLGPNPTSVTYSIDAQNRLVANNAFIPGNPMVISDNIVQLQVQYGFSSACPPPASTATVFIPCRIDSTASMPGTIVLGSPLNQWGDIMPGLATANDWRKIVAVRMAIVARSSEPQSKEEMNRNPDLSKTCWATTVQPIWQTTGTTLWVDADTNWKCYRYKVFELVVPIRNMMWYPDPNGNPVPM
jgi:type IV pilus assembly protein PilW